MRKHFEAIKPAMVVLKTLLDARYEAVVAGGAVRDVLLGRPVSDLDIATNASPDEVMHLFKEKHPEFVGRQFPLVLVRGVEVATFRGNTLDEDLAARDLTINAMAWDFRTDRIIDPWGGQKDMASKRLAFTRDAEARIKADPLRLLRMARFAAELSWEVDAESLSAMKRLAHLLDEVPKERVHHEILKGMAGKRASDFFEVTRASGLLEILFPEMLKSVGHDGGPHHDETVWEHMMMATDAISPKFPLLRLSMALHDIAKPACAEITEAKGLRFIGHEKVGETMVDADLERLGFSNRERAYASKIVRHHMRRIDHETTPKAVRKILRDLAASDLPWRDWMRGVLADGKANRRKKGGYTLDEIRLMVSAVYAETRGNKKGGYTISHLAVKGGDVMQTLNMPSGPQVGHILKYLLERVIENPEMNTREALLEEARRVMETNELL